MAKTPSGKVNPKSQNPMENLSIGNMDILKSGKSKNARSPWYGKPTFSDGSGSGQKKGK